jgi:serine/threonine-protein kinase
MEYVAGESLRERLRREGALPLAEALRLATEMAEALEAAHSAGVIHRDIKPHNVLLGPEGQVKVTDFGIARAVSAAGNTETGVLMGSVNYVSPEQARGEVVGPQSDLYSLGVTLFEMLSGRPPFDGGERLAVLHKHIYDRAPAPSEFRPSLPHEVDFIVLHCLEKDLSRRFASARELLGYLAACPRQERGGRGPSWGWRRRLSLAASTGWQARRRVIGIGLMVMLAAALAGLGLWAAARSRPTVVSVPDVVGMSEAAARELLRDTGLGYRQVGRRESQEVPAGSVLSQDPPPHERVPPEAVVKVVVSEGPTTVVVPNVTQMSRRQARRNLEAAGLSLGAEQEAYDDHVPAGYVARTYPNAGARVVRSTAVDIVVSQGPKPALPPGPPLPPQPGSSAGREERLDFTVPAEVGPGEAKVVVEVTDERGKRIVYEGRHGAGEHIPTQTLTITARTTARVLVNDRVRAEYQYEP